MKINKKFKKAFTLVELVVVIAVIAILSAVSVGAYFGITDSANSSAAEQYKKQVKDIWTMFTVSDGYTKGTSDDVARQNAEEFCLTYAQENGPQNVAVNYKLVDVNPLSDVKALKNSTFTDTGVMFFIDSNYDSYFVTIGERIYFESNLIKSEDDFKNLMNDESTSFMSNEDRDLFRTLGFDAFELSSFGSGEETVYGYEYYQVNITGDKTDSLYVRTNRTLHEESKGVYATTEVKTFTQVVGREYVLYYENGNEVVPENLFTKDNLSSSFEPQLIGGTTNNYCVGTINLTYDALLTSNFVNLNYFPICDLTYSGDAGSTSTAIYFDDFAIANDYIKNQTEGIHYLFVGNTTLDSNFTIPSNYTMVIDDSISTATTTTTEENVQQMKKFATYLYHDTANLNKLNLENRVGENKVDQIKNGTLYTPNSTTLSGREFTISKNAVLTVEGRLLNEGIFNVASGGNNGISITKASRIITEENSSIIIKNGGSLRSLGKIEGPGTIEAQSGAKVIEPLNVTSFFGGGRTYYAINGLKRFPFFDYYINSIESHTKFMFGSSYECVTGFSMTGVPKLIVPVGLIGETNCLFKLVEDNSCIEKKYDVVKEKVILDLHGKIEDLVFAINLKIGLTESLQFDLELSSLKYNFPLTNLIINVNEDAELTLKACDKYRSANYELMPTSELHVKGKLNIVDKTLLQIFNKRDFSDITVQSTFEWSSLLFEKFKKFNDNRMLYLYTGSTIEGNIYAINEESNLYIDEELEYYGWSISTTKSSKPYVACVSSSGSGLTSYIGKKQINYFQIVINSN